VAFSAGGGGGAGYSDLPDPKSRIDTHSEVIRALEVGRSGDTDKAIDILQKVSIREPETPFVHFTLASEYFRAKLFLMAAEHFQKAVELQPESDAGARFNLARSLYHAGLSSRAELVAKEILTDDPKHFSARHLLASLMAKRGDYRQAEKEELEVLKIRPYYLPALNNLGSYLLEMGKTDEAIKYFSRGLEVDPNIAVVRRNLVLAYMANADYRKAAREAEIIVGMLPESMLGHYYLGQAYKAMGETGEARRSFDKARELDPRISIPPLDN
jgi:tetratricopeptide (TPR) repeat protein